MELIIAYKWGIDFTRIFNQILIVSHSWSKSCLRWCFPFLLYFFHFDQKCGPNFQLCFCQKHNWMSCKRRDMELSLHISLNHCSPAVYTLPWSFSSLHLQAGYSTKCWHGSTLYSNFCQQTQYFPLHNMKHALILHKRKNLFFYSFRHDWSILRQPTTKASWIQPIFHCPSLTRTIQVLYGPGVY